MAIDETYEPELGGKLAPTANWRDYVNLLKPRVMSLVIFTAIVGYACAHAQNNLFLATMSILAIAMGAGAAGSLNMYIDADIDGLMKRTRMRPVPAGKVAKEEALNMGIIFSLLSVVLLAFAANYLAAFLLAFTIFFYAVVYSIWLKRATPQNIVIGGLAGALPPLVAWVAASGTIEFNALLLVAIILLWTPPHSWALALYKAGDYAAAGVPMMPVAKGAKSTRLQILLYSILLVPLAILPSFTGLGGWIYFGVSTSCGVVFLMLAIRLWRSEAGTQDGRVNGRALYEDSANSNRPARNLFAFSLLYLTALFTALLVEHAFGLFYPLNLGGF